MALRTLTFSDHDSGVWGAAWELDGQPGFVLVGDDRHSGAPQAALRGEWSLVGDGIELESSATGVPSALEGGLDQLARIRGQIQVGGAQRSVDCPGRRGARDELTPAACGSVRDISAWFPSGDGVALVAARPQRSRGHDDEVLTVSAFEAGQALPVADPRLSTTYAEDGSPIRAGLELWLERLDVHEDSTEETVLYSRRVAGEAVSSVAAAPVGSLAVAARRFRWHSRGEEGSGVYVIVRPS